MENELKKLIKKHSELENKCLDIFSVTLDDIRKLEEIKKKINQLKK